METFRSCKVVPDVIDDVPAQCLQVSWDGKQLRPGDIWTPRNVKDVPDVTFDGEPGAYYTLIHSDPDAPTTAFPEFLHWLVTNIPGNDIAKGDEMAAYLGSGAPKDTGFHRYVFLLYKQTEGRMNFHSLERIPNNIAKGRHVYKAREFANKYKLVLEAANFYRAEWDDYVPIIHEQIGFGKK